MITLNIEDTCIKLMLVDGKQVVKVASQPLEPGLVENGEVIDRTTVSRRISELISSQNISDKHVITGLTGLHSMYSTVSLPHLTEKIVPEAARREMDRVMAVPLAELYTSWQAVDVSPDETVLCLVGLPRNTVDAMLETLRLSGLRSIGLDIVPLALARLADEKDALIVNVQHASFDIVVMASGIPELLRSLTFPSGNIADKDKVILIKEELERTVTFYNSSHQENPITKNIATFISGELQEILASSLDYRQKPLSIRLSSQLDFDNNEYAINVSLALKEIKDERIPLRVSIDVMPAVYKPKPRQLIDILSWIVLALVVIILVPFAIVTQRTVAETTNLAGRVNSIEVQIGDRQAANLLFKMLQSTVDASKVAQQAIRSSLDVFKSQVDKVNGDLGTITSSLPGTVNLTSISYAGKVFIIGNAPNKEMILTYSRALRNTGRFSNVIVSDMHEVDYQKWAFSLSLE